MRDASCLLLKGPYSTEWAVEVRCWYETSPYQYTQLHVPPQIKFDFSFDEAREAAWNQRLEELRLFAKDHGGVAHVLGGDPERPELGTWCHNQARCPSPRTAVDWTVQAFHLAANQAGREQYQKIL